MSRKSDKPKPVSVYVRCRPRNATEKAAGSHSVIDCTKKEVTVKHANSTINKKYTFDHVYGTESSQVDVYKGMCLLLIVVNFKLTIKLMCLRQPVSSDDITGL